MDIASIVSGSQKLTAIFGRWPSFHDGEVHEVLLSRDVAESGSPTLLVKVHIWEMTREVDPHGYYVTRNHNLVSMMFSDISELELQGFNGGNIILDLAIESIANTEDPSNLMNVQLDTSYGLWGSFRCKRIEVLEVVACARRSPRRVR